MAEEKLSPYRHPLKPLEAWSPFLETPPRLGREKGGLDRPQSQEKTTPALEPRGDNVDALSFELDATLGGAIKRIGHAFGRRRRKIGRRARHQVLPLPPNLPPKPLSLTHTNRFFFHPAATLCVGGLQVSDIVGIIESYCESISCVG